MQHTDEKQKQNEVQSENRLEYIVANNLEDIDGVTCYKLEASDKNIEVQTLYIKTDKIVLAPGLSLFITVDKLLNEQILDIEKFNEDTCLRLIEKHKECLYIVTPFTEILFPIEVKALNNLHSGTVMQKNESDFNIYEVKLDNEIVIPSIGRIFKKITVTSDNLLNGFKLKNIKIEAKLLFNVNHNTEYEKPLLYSYYTERKDLLASEDSWLFKKYNFLKGFNDIALKIVYVVTFIIVLLNISATHVYFSFPWVSFFVYGILLLVAFVFLSNKVKEAKNEVIKTKNDLISAIKKTNIIGTFFSIFFIFLSLFMFSRHYEYKENLVYDNENKTFLESNSFRVTSDLIFDTNYITHRFEPVYTNYSFDIIVDNTNESTTFSKEYLDLKIDISLKKGNYLLDLELKNKLMKVREVFIANINNGLYGDLYTENNFHYRKILIEIEEDINNLLEITLNKDSNSSVVSNINITTKYAKLQNVDN